MIRMRRWLHTCWLRLIGFVVRSHWILLSFALATLGVVGVWTTIPSTVNFALAAISLVILGLDWRRHLTELRSMSFIDQSPSYDDVVDAYAGSARFDVVRAHDQHVLIDHAAARAISTGEATASLRGANYILPEELAAGTRYRATRIKRRGTYNGHLVGLDTDLGGDDEPVPGDWKLVAGRYWDHLASDILASKLTQRDGHPVPTLGRALYIDRSGRARDYGESWLLNAVGTSILAVTTDRKLVVVSQSELNESSGGLLAPSGSGSLEPADFRGAAELPFATLARNGAVRELGEETRVPESAVIETAPLGFGRWLEKAAKPEVWTVAALDVDSHGVKRLRVPSHERPFTTHVDAVRFRGLDAWQADRPDTVLEGVPAYLMSVPLVVGLRLMVREVARTDSPAGRLVRRALG